METKIRDFCRKYKERKGKGFISDMLMPLNKKLIFRINVKDKGAVGLMMSDGDNLFELDDEDLEYLYKKYSKRVVVEMNENIDNIKGAYRDDIKTTIK